MIGGLWPMASCGTFTFSGREGPSVVLIGGGVGITPMMSIARYLTDAQWPGTIYLLTSFLTPQDIIFRREIEGLRVRNPRLRVATTVTNTQGDDWIGPTGFIDDCFIQAHIPDIALHPSLICGPPAMMDAVKATLSRSGVPSSQVKTEAFGTDRRDPSRKVEKSGKIVAKVSFQESHLSADAREGMTLLDVADEAGVFIDSACRSGTCGTCSVKLTRGKVRRGTDDALSDEEREQGYILACQAQPVGNVALDA